MKRQLRIFMSGVLIVVPVVISVWVIIWLIYKLGQFGHLLLSGTGIGMIISSHYHNYAAAGAVVLVFVAIYLIGLLAKFWIFGRFFDGLDRVLSRVPGIRVVYESVRDLLKLFGAEGQKMGYSVIYSPDGSSMKLLGIVTNENPAGQLEGDDSVIVYLPLGYMIGGPIVYARPDELTRIDIAPEVAMKLAVTAFVGVGETPEQQKRHARQALDQAKDVDAAPPAPNSP